jgi:Fe2+ or Zn2+ uptake regulation protein
MRDIQHFKDELKARGLRVTQPRVAVASILMGQEKRRQLSPEEVFSQIKKTKKWNCDQASVYRALATFVGLKLVNKSLFQGEASRYALAGAADTRAHAHKHFFKCRECQSVKSFHECFVSKKEKELENLGYRDIAHHLEISGVCPNCAA